MRRLSWVGRLTAVAAGTLSIGAAAPPPVQSPQACRVEFTQLNEFIYGPEKLKVLVIEGHHTVPARPGSATDSPTAFQVLDLNGIFEMAVLVNHWRSSGAFHRNLTEPVNVPRRDVLMLLDAADRGLAYVDVEVATIRALPPAERMNESTAFFLRILEDMRPELLRVQATAAAALDQSGASASSVVLPRGVMSNPIGVGLDRFLPGAPNQLFSLYFDRAVGGERQLFCGSSAANSTIEEAFCGFVFSTGVRRDPAFCPEGLVVGELARAKFCRRSEDGESNCTSSAYP